MSRPLFGCLREIRARLELHQHWLLGLDYDGTLTAIVSDPTQALLAAAVRAWIKKCATFPWLTVAIVSGRSLTDVREKVALAEVIYAGNHGWEIAGPAFFHQPPFPPELQAVYTQLSRQVLHEIHQEIVAIAGARIEDKGQSASIHYRQVAPHLHERIRVLVETAVAPHADTLRLRHGHMVWEVRPHWDWHKGHALGWLLRNHCPENTLPFYFGDDSTDEDVFQAFPEGITVKVGPTSPTQARYRVSAPPAVHDFLEYLALGHRSRALGSAGAEEPTS